MLKKDENQDIEFKESWRDEYLQSYVVLDSCDYLVEFFNKIQIKE